MVSHNPEDAQLIADQVLFVDEGRIALQGKPDILQNSAHPGLLRYLGRAG
jgi:thiamine transport system ATP-binding protein